jgi:hypothetical protein
LYEMVKAIGSYPEATLSDMSPHQNVNDLMKEAASYGVKGLVAGQQVIDNAIKMAGILECLERKMKALAVISERSSRPARGRSRQQLHNQTYPGGVGAGNWVGCPLVCDELSQCQFGDVDGWLVATQNILLTAATQCNRQRCMAGTAAANAASRQAYSGYVPDLQIAKHSRQRRHTSQHTVRAMATGTTVLLSPLLKRSPLPLPLLLLLLPLQQLLVAHSHQGLTHTPTVSSSVRALPPPLHCCCCCSCCCCLLRTAIRSVLLCFMALPQTV